MYCSVGRVDTVCTLVFALMVLTFKSQAYSHASRGFAAICSEPGSLCRVWQTSGEPCQSQMCRNRSLIQDLYEVMCCTSYSAHSDYVCTMQTKILKNTSYCCQLLHCRQRTEISLFRDLRWSRLTDVGLTDEVKCTSRDDEITKPRLKDERSLNKTGVHHL